eukprot:4501268-Ditylum_brightwellii.AAC.1
MERGADQQAQQIQEEYRAKAQKCDNKFAQDALAAQRLFEDAIKKFLTGGPTPLVFRAFGE